MNILFFSVTTADIDDRGSIYGGLLLYFIERGHHVCAVSALERKKGKNTHIEEGDGYEQLFVRTPNIFKTSSIEKGIAYLTTQYLFRRAIGKHWGDRHFDLILYPTPPPIYGQLIKWCKGRYPGAISYMLLKDIFPQNAVDLGMMSKGGVTYRLFKSLELATMHASDFIGCMSPANVEYVHANYPGIAPSRVDLCPNTAFPSDLPSRADRNDIRLKLNLPLEEVLFVYGGNLGKPQGIPHLLECIAACKEMPCHFVIIGKGTEYAFVKEFISTNKLDNTTQLDYLPTDEYNRLVTACDVGLISLCNRFTFPNFPSRLLGYTTVGLPVLAVTDRVSDVGRIAEENGFGMWCPADNTEDFVQAVQTFISNKEQLSDWGKKGHQFMLDHYTHEVACNTIVSHLDNSIE